MNTSQQSQESTGSNDGSQQNSYDEEYLNKPLSTATTISPPPVQPPDGTV
jgi:hypothetical protein